MATDNSDCASTSTNLVRKHKAKSPVWDYLGCGLTLRAEWLNRQLISLCVRAGSNGKLGESLGMRLPQKGMLFMIIVMTGIMIIANTNYQYHATLVC